MDRIPTKYELYILLGSNVIVLLTGVKLSCWTCHNTTLSNLWPVHSIASLFFLFCDKKTRKLKKNTHCLSPHNCTIENDKIIYSC